MGIINDILDFSKIEANKLEIINANFDLTALIDNLHSLFCSTLLSKDVTLTCTIADEVPSLLYGDEARLRQILSNLLSNAVKYTHEGAVVLSVEVGADPSVEGGAVPAHVAIDSQNAAHVCTAVPGTDAAAEIGALSHIWLAFSVKDTGIGIKRGDLARLFSPFEQLDLRKNRNVVGTGLGLAIAQQLSELMGGCLSARSVYHLGSIFTLVLPLGVDVVEEPEPDEVELPEFCAPGARVLVVDDLEINLSVAEAVLETVRIVPDRALSGEEALRLCHEKHYDVIFMDHMMPEMDGMDTTRLIRSSNSSNSTTPVVALTANVVSGMRETFLQNGFDDFLAKPIDMGELRRILFRWLPIEVMEKGAITYEYGG
jgi:CheY-like chemotaxis protein